MWDATSGEKPPSFDNNVSPGPPEYHLLVDKGTIDAVCFSSSDQLIAYLCTVRECLTHRFSDGSVPPLLVHFTDDPPEVRSELLEAAFPSTDSLRWKISCAMVEDSLDIDDHQGHEYYRYTVHCIP